MAEVIKSATKRHIAHGTGTALPTACALLLVLLSGCNSGPQAPTTPKDVQSVVGIPGQSTPVVTDQTKAAQAKGEAIGKEQLAQHTTGTVPMEGR